MRPTRVLPPAGLFYKTKWPSAWGLAAAASYKTNCLHATAADSAGVRCTRSFEIGFPQRGAGFINETTLFRKWMRLFEKTKPFLPGRACSDGSWRPEKGKALPAVGRLPFRPGFFTKQNASTAAGVSVRKIGYPGCEMTALLFKFQRSKIQATFPFAASVPGF